MHLLQRLVDSQGYSDITATNEEFFVLSSFEKNTAENGSQVLVAYFIS